MKKCSRCKKKKPLTEYAIRKASSDGCSAACKVCINRDKRNEYTQNEIARAEQVARSTAARKARSESDPAYNRAMNLHRSTQRRTKIPRWVKALDFYKLCQKAVKAGPDSHLDHIIPLHHPLVSGLHVPWNVRVTTSTKNITKGSTFKTDW